MPWDLTTRRDHQREVERLLPDSDDVNEYLQAEVSFSDQVTSHEITLVKGNIRGFAGWLRSRWEQLAESSKRPADGA